MEDKRDDLSMKCGASSIDSRYAYLIAKISAMVTWALTVMIVIGCPHIIDIIQSDDLASEIYNVVSKDDSGVVTLYAVSYLIWVASVIYMILYKMCTAKCKIHHMNERFAMLSPVFIAICMIMPFVIGFTQAILAVVLGATITYNIILDYRYSKYILSLPNCQHSKSISPLQNKHLILNIVTILIAIIGEGVSTSYDMVLGRIILYISLTLILISSMLTDRGKNGNASNQ